MDKVVKCKNGKCGLHFMHTKENTKCPFCHAEYGEVEAPPVRSESDSDTRSEEKTEEKEETTSTQKGAFKIKIVKNKDS